MNRHGFGLAGSIEAFEATYDKLYELSEEMYDWIAKVEPQSRAFSQLGVAAVLTGRRRSQGGARDKIPVLEIDEERGGVLRAIEFDRIAGHKAFDIDTPWFREVMERVGQKVAPAAAH